MYHFFSRALIVALIAFLPVLAFACGDDDSTSAPTANSSTTTAAAAPASTTAAASSSASATSATAANFKLISSAFADNGELPTDNTCDGKGVSPSLTWVGIPDGTNAFALIVNDPDAKTAGGFTHWVVYDLPGATTYLDGGISPGGKLPTGAKEGQNSSGANGYAPACPPAGADAHHYVFTLYALDAPLNLEAGKSQGDVEAALKSHTRGKATVTATFGH